MTDDGVVGFRGDGAAGTGAVSGPAVCSGCGHRHGDGPCADHPWRDDCRYDAGADCPGHAGASAMVSMAGALSRDLEQGMRGGGLSVMQRVGPGVFLVHVGGGTLRVTVAPESGSAGLRSFEGPGPVGRIVSGPALVGDEGGRS